MASKIASLRARFMASKIASLRARRDGRSGAGEPAMRGAERDADLRRDRVMRPSRTDRDPD